MTIVTKSMTAILLQKVTKTEFETILYKSVVC